MNLLVYVHKITPRIQYITRLICGDLMGLEFSVTDQKDEFIGFNGPKFSYSPEPIGNEMFIQSVGLLSETGITEQKIDFISFNGVPAFFQTTDTRSVFPFDCFSAAFFLVSRYEEYLPFKQDEYGRFPVIESTAAKGGFLRVPVVNLWTQMLVKEIQKRFPDIQLGERKFRFIPTIDIDHAYAYKHRSIIRTLGGIGNSIIRRRGKQLGQRIKVLLGLAKDPYDTYDYIHQCHKERRVKALYFMLFAQRSHHDNNVSLKSRAFRQLIKTLAHHGAVGIHPSLGSNKRFTKLEAEITGLSEVLGHKIAISRQHFLKVSFPRTYQNLINAGIKHDYSMGYASEPGFKASIADPFKFYNLVSETETPLIIHPITLMDVTLRDYYRLDATNGTELSKSLIDAARNVNGEFVSLWHNESFSESGRWKHWRKVYEDVLLYATGKPKGR